MTNLETTALIVNKWWLYCVLVKRATHLLKMVSSPTRERGQSWGLSSGDPGICVMSLTRSTPQRRQLGRTNGKLVTQVLGSPHRAFIIYWVVVIFIVAVDWIKNAWLLHWCICRFPCCGFNICNFCTLSRASRTGACTWWAPGTMHLVSQLEQFTLSLHFPFL